MKDHSIAPVLVLNLMLIFAARLAITETHGFAYVDCEMLRTISAADANLLVAWPDLARAATDQQNTAIGRITTDDDASRPRCEYDGTLALKETQHQHFKID